MRTESVGPFSPRAAAIAAFVCFAPVVVTFAVAPGVRWAEYPGIFFHLSVFLLVPSLKAPDWARTAGYGWLLLDVTAGVLAIRSVPHEVSEAVRLGAHIFAGIWIVMASLSASLPMKLIGVPMGLWLSGYTFVSMFLPMSALAPASLLMLAWLALIAWRNEGNCVPRQRPVDELQSEP
jgi:hypothetical protein